ncbi:major facilitator superfamily domain-containing protein [Aspergillus undulatus]|uniref:major facilitator superfamily domain-containing protein n=1 Tax=Aspergillus undulatus TaxID=1810928 RepID=UPI003CCD5C6F
MAAATEQTLLLPPPVPALRGTVFAAIASTWIASFAAAADSTITATLSSTIANEFQSLTVISWLGSGYLIGLTVTQPLCGKLSDIFGRNASYLFAALVFAAGNLVCGLAGSQSTLILGRVVAGVGGGGCSSISTIITSDYVAPRSRGLWYSFGMGIYTVGMACGAVMGGAINDALGWRWAFIILAPIAVVAGGGVAVFLPQRTAGVDSFYQQLCRIDYGGSITLVSSVALLLIYLNQDTDDSRAATEGLLAKTAIPLAAILLALFIVIELCWAREPIMPLPIFRTPSVLAACLSSWLMPVSVFTLTFYIPLYLQLRGYSTSETGVRLLPQSIGAGLGSFTAGLVTRHTGKYSTVKIIMPSLLVFGAAGFVTISMTSPPVLTEIYLFLHGAGFGGLQTVLFLALLSAVPFSEQATSTCVLLAFRSIGSTVGVSAAGIVFRSRLGHQDGHGHGHGNDGTLDQDAHMSALHATFILALASAVAGFVAVLFVRDFALRSTVKDCSESLVEG